MTLPLNILKGVHHISNSLLMNKLEVNLKSWLDLALLKIGAWTDVATPTNTDFGGDLSILRAVHDPSYTNYTVYESARKDWIWETGVDYVDKDLVTQNPVSPAIVYVNGIPSALLSINYPLGRVIFDSAQSSSSIVTANYSYRTIQTYIADSIPWWQTLQYRSLRQDDTHFEQFEDGSWAINSPHRIQMPCIVIEAVPRSHSVGYELGSGAVTVYQDILCYVLAENRRDRNDITDILRGQFDNTIWLFDDDLIAADEVFPLDADGDIINSIRTYDYFVDELNSYRWRRCRFFRTETSDIGVINERLHQGLVRLTCEVVLE